MARHTPPGQSLGVWCTSTWQRPKRKGVPGGASRLVLNMDDEITKEIVVTKDGTVVHAGVREFEAVS